MTQFPKLNKRLGYVLIAFLGFVGFLDATYLTVEHFAGAIPPCSITSGCETVLTSLYATLFGIPVALGGMLYYLVVFLLAVFFLINGKDLRFILRALVSAGFLISLFFLGIQAFVLEAFCFYCLISLATSTLLFIFVWLTKIKNEVH